MRVTARTRVLVEIVVACRVGVTAHGIVRAVPVVVGPNVPETRLLGRSGGRCLGMLSRLTLRRVKRGAKGAVVFTPGRE